MARLGALSASLCILAVCAAVQASQPAGLLAEWNFNEGRGDVAHDSSGNGRDAQIHGPTWVKQGRDFAISLDGFDDYIDCTAAKPLGISGPLTFELWIKPTRKAHGMSCIIGESLTSYLLTYYNTELCQLYIGDGGNSVRGSMTLNEWNHVVTSFDGKTLNMWINGRLTGSNPSRYPTYTTTGKANIGTAGQPDLPRFKGLLDTVRVYDRALTQEEVSAHFLAEASDHDVDLTVFERPKVTPYYYLDRGEVVIDADFQGLLPLKGNGRFEVSLASQQKPDEVISKVQSDETTIPNGFTRYGFAEVTLPLGNLAKGNYILRAMLTDEHGAYPVDEFSFAYPAEAVPFPAPQEKTVGPLPLKPSATPFKFAMDRQGGFYIGVNNQSYPFRTRISWPKGGFNQLSAGDARAAEAERVWRVQIRGAGKDKYEVAAVGAFYTLRRSVEVFPTHVYVKDTYTNTTAEDLGLLIYNETPVMPNQVTDSRLSGYERRGRQAALTYPDYNPSSFFTDAHTGMGIVPIDDVFVIQAVPYVEWQGAAGVATEKFALAPGDSYTLEWAVYPTESKDYYDFINAFRQVEGRIGTVEGAPDFITTTPHVPWRREVVDKDFIAKRNLKLGLMHSISEIADDPNLHLEGIELFRDFPKEMELIRQQVADTHKLDPQVKMLQHIAASIYCTNNPQQFADSRVIGPDGKQATWGDGSAFGPQRQAEGWRWWIFYPMPGNSFHNAMMDSVDVMMDDVGLGGGFMDGFLAGYGGMWTYDRWDGHSAEIDANTKTITRKLGSVMLLSQPSMIEYARKIRDKGGYVVAMHTVFTRSIANENDIIFSNEAASGPELHLAPSAAVLGNHTGFRSEKHIYLDILSKLQWGELYIHYADGRTLTHRSLASYQYPMTFEQMRPGMVRGPQRIVTMNSGVYGWPDDHRLHRVYKFDSRGALVQNDSVTTVDSAGVRTEMTFNEHESAVIEPIPVELKTTVSVNVRVIDDDNGVRHIQCNGQGDVVLRMESTTAYRAAIDGKATNVESESGVVAIPLTLNGLVDVSLEPMAQGN